MLCTDATDDLSDQMRDGAVVRPFMNVAPTCAAVAVELAVVCAFAIEVFTLYPPAVAGSEMVPRSSYVALPPADIDCSENGRKVSVPPVELVPHASAV